MTCCLPFSLEIAVITWAKQQIEKYAEIFRKQVYSKDVDPQIVEDALSITRAQSKKVRALRSQGLMGGSLIISI